MKLTTLILACLAVFILAFAGCDGGGSGSGKAEVTTDNFHLLISDENNAIEDFSELWVNITGIGVHKTGNGGGWIQLSPENPEINLRALTGENATAIWSGDLEPGNYTKIFIYVSEAQGILENGGDTVTVQVPSNKLQISRPFTIDDSQTTDFVYDITVIHTGNDKYQLSPQIAKSGADQPFSEVDDDDDGDVDDTDGSGNQGVPAPLSLELVEMTNAGGNFMLTVTDNSVPVEGARVLVNGVDVGMTDSDGSLSLFLPTGEEEIEIAVTWQDREGVMEFEVESDDD